MSMRITKKSAKLLRVGRYLDRCASYSLIREYPRSQRSQ